MAYMLRSVARGIIIFGFFVASGILKHRPHLRGKQNLKKLPTPVIFTLTHDSYFEVPSLSRVYFSLKPKLDFFILGKDDFLSGRYLASNFGKKSRILRYLLTILDMSKLPEAVFKIMRVTTIHRPFIESYQLKKEAIKWEISQQLHKMRDNISHGISTVIFPEGTTWGFGGLKRMRSAVYQLVENTFRQTHQKVYILPINVKVDKLVKGKKDIFINVGNPIFFRSSKDEFNARLAAILRQLHTITFSQIAAYYIKRIAERLRDENRHAEFTREKFVAQIERIVADLNIMVEKKLLPYIDSRLVEHDYLRKKAWQFIRYCEKKNYLTAKGNNEGVRTETLNTDVILSESPASMFRKLNPLAFHANELASLNEELIKSLYDPHLKEA